MAYYCKNRVCMMQERRVEYGGERIEEINDHRDNLKRVENLELLD